MSKKHFVGQRVRSNREFFGVPVGSEGVIDEVLYYSGTDRKVWMVAWDLPESPLPEGYTKYDGKPAVATGILRDGFGADELKYLDPVDDGSYTVLYHGTSSSRIDAIVKEGLKCRADLNGVGNWPEEIASAAHRVYLTNAYAPYYALAAAEADGSSHGVVVKLAIPHTMPMVADEDFLAQNKSVTRMHNLGHLTLKERVKFWSKFSYQELLDMGLLGALSLAGMGTCAVIGSIPPERILGIRPITAEEWIRIGDPSITIANYKLLGEYYRNVSDALADYVSIDEIHAAREAGIIG